MITRLIDTNLPVWARSTHPMMRYALGTRKTHWLAAFVRAALIAILLIVAVSLSYFYVRENYDNVTLREVLYYPLVGIQLLMQLLALAITSNVIALERQKETWESLQITLSGAGNLIRARWFLVFYRMRWALLGLLLVRLIYVGLLVRETIDFEGRAIDLRIIGISPEVSMEVAVFLLSALITAAIVLPFVALSFDAAIGILFGSLIHRRGLGILSTTFLMIARILLTGGAVYLGMDMMDGNGTKQVITQMSDPERWTRTLLLTLQGDQGLRLLNLEVLGNLWADMKNGIYLGGIVLLLTMLMAVLANGMVLFAAWWAARPSKI